MGTHSKIPAVSRGFGEEMFEREFYPTGGAVDSLPHATLVRFCHAFSFPGRPYLSLGSGPTPPKSQLARYSGRGKLDAWRLGSQLPWD